MNVLHWGREVDYWIESTEAFPAPALSPATPALSPATLSPSDESRIELHQKQFQFHDLHDYWVTQSEY